MDNGGFELEGRLFREQTDRLVAEATSGEFSEEEAESAVAELMGRLLIFISAAAADARERGGADGVRAAVHYEGIVSRLREVEGNLGGG